jgi:hypothetical protein
MNTQVPPDIILAQVPFKPQMPTGHSNKISRPLATVGHIVDTLKVRGPVGYFCALPLEIQKGNLCVCVALLCSPSP